MTEISEIIYDEQGNAICFSGPKAIAIFHMAALRSGLSLLSLRAAFDQVTRYTGQSYQGKKDIERARADLEIAIAVAKTELDK